MLFKTKTPLASACRQWGAAKILRKKFILESEITRGLISK